MLAPGVAAVAFVNAGNFFLVDFGVIAENFYVRFDGKFFHGVEFAEPLLNAFLRGERKTFAVKNFEDFADVSGLRIKFAAHGKVALARHVHAPEAVRVDAAS